MPRKPMTPEERKAFGAKMKAAREAKKNKEVEQSKVEAAAANDDVSALLKRIEELEQRNFFAQPAPAPAVAVRAITKFSINPADYPDPRDRLMAEPRLESEAFKQNFYLIWEVGKVGYKSDVDGVSYTEPKFRLEVWKYVRDGATNEFVETEDPKTGAKTRKGFRVHKGTFFEDPDAAIQCAQDKGITVPDSIQQAFLDEMRYLRIRDWLFEIFWPSPIKQNRGVREEVIGNRLVPVMEISSTTPVDIPFDRL